MNLGELLQELNQKNIQLSIDGERLLYQGHKDVLTPTLLNQIRQYKAEILQLLRSSKSYPLSYGQQGLWFLYQLAPQSPAYNLAFTVRIRSGLNVPALQRACQKLILRHPTLRTTFGQGKAEPWQKVHEYQEVCFEETNAATWNWDELTKRAIAAYRLPFDLEQGSVLRVNLFTRSPQDYVFLLTIHHIAVDGFSFGIILDELRLLYQAENSGQEISLPPVSWQYQDFVQWQHQMLATPVGEELWRYWQQQLAGELPVLKLPSRQQRSPISNNEGASYTFNLTTELTSKLRETAKAQGATLYMTLLAAFVVLLHRYTGEEDILVGSPVNNRSRSEFDSIVGFFVNMLALRVNIAGNPSFSAFLNQVRSTVLAALAHQDYPSTLLVERLQHKRDHSQLGLFQVSFNLLQLQQITEVIGLSMSNKAKAMADWGGLALEPFEIPQEEGQNDLVLNMVETTESLLGTYRYNTDLFDVTIISQMAGNFKTLLEGIVAHPQQPIAHLPLLRATEQHRLLVECNNTHVEYPQNKCIHQLFETQVKQTSDAVAVVFATQQMTYQELNVRANQLAHNLQGLGVKPEVLVGICVERSCEMVVALLGVLKAGGAYVPLDPQLPPERLEFMLLDSQISVLLTQKKLVAQMPKHNAHLICLDADWGAISAKSEENPVSEVTPENLAYAIYTSGSTGTPKGVAIAHRSLVNAYFAWEQTYQLRTRTSSHLQMANFSFDVFSGDLVRALCSGGKLVLCPQESLLVPEKLYGLMREQAVDCAEFVPAVLRNLMEYLKKTEQNLHFLRLLVVGSDSWYVKEYQEFQHLCGLETRLINSYGVSEATIDSCYYENPGVNLSVDELVPIGHPFANIQIYILDRYLQLVPIGVSGELYIGGVGLARGYLNRPDLTEEKFIPHPFSDQPDSRLYKTGDLARYLSDGNIELLGRSDNQVKIRGFRIELDEIAAAIAQNQQVLEAVVIAREDQPGNKRLVAYIVPKQEQPNITELRRFLKQKLPDYMVPSAFVSLEALPLTPNGKVNRRALTAPMELNGDHSFVPPRTPTEEVIASIISTVLGLEIIGIHDNFFELGGHSLLATQVISRLRETFAVELPLRCLFESPTVAELNELIWTRLQTGSGVMTSAIKPVPRDTDLPLSWSQARLWFLNQLENQSASYNMPAALQMTGKLKIVALEQAIAEIVQRHEVLRTSFRLVNNTPVQVIDPTATVTLAVVDLQGFEENEQSAHIQRLVNLDAQKAFDVNSCPLLRLSLLQLGEDSHILVLTMHHIVSDGWSMGVFIHELSTLYQAFVLGEVSPLPDLPIQYADFAIWQRQWLRGEVYEAKLNYWKQQLADAPPLLELPIDKPRPPVQTSQGSIWKFQIDPELTQKLKTLSQKSETTLFMTLQAAFVSLLSRYSGQDDIPIGVPIANRNYQQIESLIGFFVNILVLRSNLKGNPSFSELLTQVRQVALEAYAHQDVPFEQVVEVCSPERNLSHSPLFQVMFAWQNTPMRKLELPGLHLTPLEIENVTAKFDLTLSMGETEQGLHGWWEYNSDLFEADTIARMGLNFQTMLAAIVANPQQSIRELPLLTDSERHQLLVEWNHTETEYPTDIATDKEVRTLTDDKTLYKQTFNPVPSPQSPVPCYKCIHQLFEAQVEQTPDAVAVVFEDAVLTYRELNSRANQLAQYLQTLGVESEVLVGIGVERSLDMVVGLLGILKAGGAYVPLDPTYPQERLDYMLNDSQVSVLLTQSQVDFGSPKMPVVCLDRDFGESSQENVVSGAETTNLAYVIYTSGSTGKPKGVLVTHQGLCNLALAQIRLFNISANSRVLQFASLSFDASVSEIFMTLCSGAMLVLGTPESLLPGANLIQLLHHHAITHVTLPPSALAVLPTDDLPSLQNIIVAGEAVSTELVAQWSCNRRVFNAYGPTESTVCTTIAEISDSSQKPPIGRPIPNTQIYILDNYLQPVPIGVTGELHIGGVGLARGYLNRPDLTEEKFIRNPFGRSRGAGEQGSRGAKEKQFSDSARLYKTGDLARYLSDGNIELLGRIDHQVKIRGFRIELGEIEAVLSQHHQVQEVVVIACENEPGNKRLVAYIVPKQEQPSVTELRRFLNQKLPDYMLPSAFVILDNLPLLPNGKVNRQALQTTDIRPNVEAAYIAPQNETERLIAAVWLELLQVEKVGVHDNFFELGGHSLLLVQSHRKLREIFVQELSIVDLFKYPTISYLAEYLSQEQSKKPAVVLRQDRSENRLVRRTAVNQQSQLRQKSRSTKKQ
ncbi:MAG: amino acid adenylation domain-containing protein [Nostoc sp.]|uniref:amino acid adenylation domain-containing protein n=1 Tax=Nostoc sp. TaxID=1180 RepID=UPI002FF82C03